MSNVLNTSGINQTQQSGQAFNAYSPYQNIPSAPVTSSGGGGGKTTTTNNNGGGAVLSAQTSSTAPSGGQSNQNLMGLWRSLGNTGDLPVGWGGPANQYNPDITAQVNSAYNDATNYYNNLLQTTQAGKQSYLDQYTTPYDALSAQLEGQYQQGQNLNTSQVQQQNLQQQNALSQAQNLYNQVNKGYAQRFGGSNGIGTGVSSAADFAAQYAQSQLGGNEATINSQAGQSYSQLAAQAKNIQDQHDANQNQLGSQKAGALAQAQTAFQQQIEAIQAQQGQLATQKAGSMLQALQSYQQNAQNIANQANQISAQLTANNQISQNNLRNQLAGYQALTGSSLNLPTYQNPAYQLVSGQTAMPQQAITGYYDPSKLQ